MMPLEVALIKSYHNANIVVTGATGSYYLWELSQYQLPILSSLAASEPVDKKHLAASSGDQVGIITTLSYR